MNKPKSKLGALSAQNKKPKYKPLPLGQVAKLKLLVQLASGLAASGKYTEMREDDRGRIKDSPRLTFYAVASRVDEGLCPDIRILYFRNFT